MAVNAMDLRTAAAVMASAGGKARAALLTAERRKEIAEAAARARWGKKRPKTRRKRAAG